MCEFVERVAIDGVRGPGPGVTTVCLVLGSNRLVITVAEALDRALILATTVPVGFMLTEYTDADSPGDVVNAALCGGEGNSPTQDQIETLVDLARDGDELMFRELASMLGVRAEALDAMWTGTVARTKSSKEAHA